uniref:RING-type domain-containing protein n=1 Tax=Romanomermis culicivorax TaxID=13658 RepID=A0A915HKF4_ROMCU
MSLECAICRDSYGKLKRLKCRHAFCGHCLRKIESYGRIKCPYCRQLTLAPSENCNTFHEDTQLSPFGVDHLFSQFGGRVQCTDCEADVPLHDGSWCAQCQSILCPGCCSSQGHEDHRLQVEPIDKSMAPVTYCVQQLDQLSAVHTRLTMMQKQLISEYVYQLGQAFERQLDDDLAIRLRMLKAEKQYLRQAFDLNSSRAGSVEDDKPTSSMPILSPLDQISSSSSAGIEESRPINNQEPDT